MKLCTKYIEENHRSYLFEGNSMAMLEFDIDERHELLSDFNNGNDDALTLSGQQYLHEAIQELAPNTYVNELSRVKVLPLVVVIPIASSCNLKCPYCFAQTNSGKFNFNGFSESDIERLVSRLKEINQDEKTTLIFFGGEPLLKFNLIRYTVSFIEKLGLLDNFSYSITTNGTLVTPEIASFFKKYKFSVLVSMDGYENEFNYRHFKNGKSSVAKVLENIDLLKKIEFPFEIRATITSDNPFIYETYRFFENLAIPYTLAFAYPSDNTSSASLSTYSSDSVVRVANSLSMLLEDYRKAIQSGGAIYNSVVHTLAHYIEYRKVRERVCCAGINYFTILSDGTIFSCAHFMNNPQQELGNIYNDKLFFTRDKHYAIAPNVKNLDGKCLSCWAKHICSGGCPAQKISLALPTTAPLPISNCEIERKLAEFYLSAYILIKQKE